MEKNPAANIEVEVIDSRIGTLADELAAKGEGAAFADKFEGSRWFGPIEEKYRDLESKFGWRRKMQEWAERHGLVSAVEARGGKYLEFTDRGEKLREELHRRGITIFVDGQKN